MDKVDVEIVLGSELRVGDEIEIWTEFDLITKIESFHQSSSHFLRQHFPGGAFIAKFAHFRCGMTVSSDLYYKRIIRRSPSGEGT